MVKIRTFSLKAEIIIHIPTDIIQNKQRIEDVKEGIKRAATKGLYEEGIAFEIRSLRLEEE